MGHDHSGTKMPRGVCAMARLSVLALMLGVAACVSPGLPSIVREPPPANEGQRTADMTALAALQVELIAARDAYVDAAENVEPQSLAEEFAWLADLRTRIIMGIERRLETLGATDGAASPAERGSFPPLSRALQEDRAAAWDDAIMAEAGLVDLAETALADPELSLGTKNFLRRNLANFTRGGARLVDLKARYSASSMTDMPEGPPE